MLLDIEQKSYGRRDLVGAGFGLGIPTAHQLMERFGGRLEFRHGEGLRGGLIARIIVPEPESTGDNRIK